MAAEAEKQGTGLEISWKQSQHRRRVKFQLGDSHLTISHPLTEDGAVDITVLAQCLPAAMEQVAAAIFAKESPDGIEG